MSEAHLSKQRVLRQLISTTDPIAVVRYRIRCNRFGTLLIPKRRMGAGGLPPAAGPGRAAPARSRLGERWEGSRRRGRLPSRLRLLPRDDEGGVGFDPVVRVPIPVAVVVVSGDERRALFGAGHHGVVLPSPVEVAHPDLVSDFELRGGDLFGVEEVSEPLAFGHRLVEGPEHAVEVVGALLDESFVREDPVGDPPPFDDVDPIVPGIHTPVVRVGHDAHAQRASEEVADDLAEPRPSVVVVARRAVALELAVPKQRLDGVAPSVPVQVQPDLPLGGGDDGSVSHDGPFRLSARPFGWPRGLGGAPVPGGVSGGKRKPARALSFRAFGRRVFRTEGFSRR